jgi:hypothetical protein
LRNTSSVPCTCTYNLSIVSLLQICKDISAAASFGYAGTQPVMPFVSVYLFHVHHQCIHSQTQGTLSLPDGGHRPVYASLQMVCRTRTRYVGFDWPYPNCCRLMSFALTVRGTTCESFKYALSAACMSLKK